MDKGKGVAALLGAADLGVDHLIEIKQSLHACFIQVCKSSLFNANVYFLDTKNHRIACGKIEDYTINDKGEIRVRVVSNTDETSLKIGDYLQLDRIYPTKESIINALANG